MEFKKFVNMIKNLKCSGWKLEKGRLSDDDDETVLLDEEDINIQANKAVEEAGGIDAFIKKINESDDLRVLYMSERWFEYGDNHWFKYDDNYWCENDTEFECMHIIVENKGGFNFDLILEEHY